MRTTGATPLASFILLDGQCATPTPRSFRIAMSSSVSHTPCAATVFPWNRPSPSRIRVGVMWRCASASSFSFFVSDRWMISGASYWFANARDRLQRLVGVGVKRMRRHRGDDQRIVAEAQSRNFSVNCSASAGVLLSATGNPMIVSPSTPRMPASFAASATTSSK